MGEEQLGVCLRFHGLTTSTYPEGFDRTCKTSDPIAIGRRLAANCQVMLYLCQFTVSHHMECQNKLTGDLRLAVVHGRRARYATP